MLLSAQPWPVHHIKPKAAQSCLTAFGDGALIMLCPSQLCAEATWLGPHPWRCARVTLRFPVGQLCSPVVGTEFSEAPSLEGGGLRLPGSGNRPQSWLISPSQWPHFPPRPGSRLPVASPGRLRCCLGSCGAQNNSVRVPPPQRDPRRGLQTGPCDLAGHGSVQCHGDSGKARREPGWCRQAVS